MEVRKFFVTFCVTNFAIRNEKLQMNFDLWEYFYEYLKYLSMAANKIETATKNSEQLSILPFITLQLED